MKTFPLCAVLLFLTLEAFAQLPTNFVVQGAVWPTSIGPTQWAAGSSFSQGFPIADSDAIAGTLGGVPTNLKLCTTSNCASGHMASQFRIEALWPSGNVKWVLVDGQTQSQLTSSGLGTNAAASTGDLSMFLVKSSGGGNFGGFGSNMAAQTDSTHITVTTGAATFIIQYGAPGFDLFHDVLVGSTHLVLNSNHDANDGLIIKGPVTPASSPVGACSSGTAGTQPGGATFVAHQQTACSMAYLANLDTASTCSIFGNGPLRVELKCTGSFASTSTACLDNGTASTTNCYLHWTTRYHFYYNSTKPKLQVILRNADFSVISNDALSAYKQFASFTAQVTMNLASGTRNLTFANDTLIPTTTTATGGSSDSAYIYQAFSNQDEWSEWRTIGNCTNQGDTCAVSPIHRTSGTAYSQNGYEIVKNGTVVLDGSTSNTLFTKYPRGWADETDASNNGVEIGVYRFSAYWPKSLEFRTGGNLVQIGIWPDQSEFTFTGGDQAYVVKWPGAQIHDLWFNFHVGTLTTTQLDDTFVGWQQALLAHAPFTYYNGAKDSSSGLLALMYPLVDPVGEDSYLGSGAGPTGIGLTTWCRNTPIIFGNCLLDVSNSLAAGDAGKMSIFRFWGVASGGGGNQHDFALGYLHDFLDRGCTLVSGACSGLGTSGSQPGHYFRAYHWLRWLTETGLPRSDWQGGWRCQGTANGNSCTTISAPPCDTFARCSVNENNWGYPINASANGGMEDFLDNRNGQDHAHFYSLLEMYLVSGDESLNDQIQQGFKDAFLNQMAGYSNPISTVGGNQGFGRIGATRAIGHLLMGAARMSIYLRSVNDPEQDSANGDIIGRPTALFMADNAIAYELAPDLALPGAGLGEAEPAGCPSPWTSVPCSSGISRATGRDKIASGENNNWPPWPAGGTNVRAKQSFHSAFLVNGLYEYCLAAADLRGPGKACGASNWYKSYSGACPTPTSNGGWFNPVCNVHNTTAQLIGDQIVLDMTYGISKEMLVDSFVNAGQSGNGLPSDSGWSVYTFIDHLNSTDISSSCNAKTSCTACSFPGDCSRLGPDSRISYQEPNQSDTWMPWFGLWALSNAGTQDLSGSSYQLQLENSMKRKDAAGGFGDDVGAYHLDAVIDTILKHNPTAPATYTNSSTLPVLLTLALTCNSHTGTASCPTSTTCAGGASGGTCTLGWTPPSGLTAVNGTSYRLRYSTSKSVVTWNPWYSNCLTSSTSADCTTQLGGTNPVTVNASDSSGGWVLDPATNISWSWATQIPDNGSNSTVPSGSSYTFTAAASTTYHFLLSAYRSLAAPPPTKFTTTIQR